MVLDESAMDETDECSGSLIIKVEMERLSLPGEATTKASASAAFSTAIKCHAASPRAW